MHVAEVSRYRLKKLFNKALSIRLTHLKVAYSTIFGVIDCIVFFYLHSVGELNSFHFRIILFTVFDWNYRFWTNLSHLQKAYLQEIFTLNKTILFEAFRIGLKIFDFLLVLSLFVCGWVVVRVSHGGSVQDVVLSVTWDCVGLSVLLSKVSKNFLCFKLQLKIRL